MEIVCLAVALNVEVVMDAVDAENAKGLYVQKMGSSITTEHALSADMSIEDVAGINTMASNIG